MVAKEPHAKQRWELAAETLASDVRWLLDYREDIIDALRESPGKEEADAKLREIHALVTALEIELAYAATSQDRAAISLLSRLLKGAAMTVGNIIVTTATTLVVTDVHDALTAVDTQADQVIECVIEADDRIIDVGDGTSEVIVDAGDGAPAPSEGTAQSSEGEQGREVELKGTIDGGATEASGDLTVTPATDEPARTDEAR